MQAEPLPYDMGNAGDLIKHGLIAEFCEWWLENYNGIFRLIDPFAGRPYVSPPNPEVSRRIQQLAPCALKRAQRDIDRCYYGSGNVIRQVAQVMNREAQVYISDRNEKAIADFLEAGFLRINCKGFNHQESFSILDCAFDPDKPSFLLLDPFDDFLPEYASSQVPKLREFILNNGVPVALFVLFQEESSAQENGDLARKWQALKDAYLARDIFSISLTCPKLPSSVVAGETRFDSEITLLLQVGYGSESFRTLTERLQMFSELAGKILGRPVRFACG